MKNILRFNLALMTFVAGVQASAQLVDLPNPMDDIPTGPVAAPTPTGTPIPVTPRPSPTPTPTPTPSPTPRVVVVIPATPKATPTPTPTPEVKTARATNYAEILNITRKTGGAWYGIEFVGGGSAEEFYLMGSTNIGVKVHEIRAITDSGQSIPLKMNSSIGNVLGYMGTIPQITNVSNIKRLELRLESMGGVGRLMVQATTFGYLALRPVEAGPQVIVPPPTIPSPQIPSPSGTCASGSSLPSQLRPLKSAMLDWAYQMQTTSYGSSTYRRAEQNMNAYGQKMISLVTSQSVLRGSTDEIKTLAQDYAYEMNTVSYGTVIYKVYNHIAATAYGAIPTSLNMAIKCRSWSFRQILSAAADYAYEAQTSSYGSMANTAFTKSAEILYNLAPSRYQQEARGKDYQQLVNDMKDYAYEQNTTSYGSIQNTTYDAIKVRAGNMAQAAFRMYVFRLNRNQRQRLAQDYQYEMQTTSYGSYQYNFYETMMNIALGR